MILSIYNFKLYYPGHGYDGRTPSQEGGQEARETKTDTSDESRDPVVDTASNDSTNGGKTTIEEDEKNKNQNKLVSALFPKVKSNYKFEKIIKVFTTDKQKNGLDSDGERRQIIVNGTPGSIFSITIEDSAGCNMLKKEVKNKKIPSSGTFVFLQSFPSIKSEGEAVKTKETYSFKLTVAADVLRQDYNADDFTLEQIADPVLTITKTTSQTGPA